jgi:hypothetical protein
MEVEILKNVNGNSNKSKEGQAQQSTEVRKVIQGTAEIRKPTWKQKFRDNFIKEDAKTVKDYVFNNFMVPAIQNMIQSSVNAALDVFFRGQRVSSGRYNGWYNPYNQQDNRGSGTFWRSAKAQDNVVPIQSAYPRRDYNNILLDSMDEGELVMLEIENTIKSQGFMSIATLFRMTGIPTEATDFNWGWTSVRGFDTNMVHNDIGELKCLLVVPRPQVIR